MAIAAWFVTPGAGFCDGWLTADLLRRGRGE
jgi:hypothetical protein